MAQAIAQVVGRFAFNASSWSKNIHFVLPLCPLQERILRLFQAQANQCIVNGSQGAGHASIPSTRRANSSMGGNTGKKGSPVAVSSVKRSRGAQGGAAVGSKGTIFKFLDRQPQRASGAMQ